MLQRERKSLGTAKQSFYQGNYQMAFIQNTLQYNSPTAARSLKPTAAQANHRLNPTAFGHNGGHSSQGNGES
jgi:hypothetical protein